MSKNNPTKAEKCRSTKLSKCDVSTLVGIILRKDAKEKNLNDKVKATTNENNILHETVAGLTNKVDSLEKQLKTFNAIFATNKQILESTKTDNKRLTEHISELAFNYSKARHKAMYMYIISVILINIAWIIFACVQ
jgi:peptidoglycan hydrolase CwlO-like protein